MTGGVMRLSSNGLIEIKHVILLGAEKRILGNDKNI
jgi:hypothetical protein